MTDSEFQLLVSRVLAGEASPEDHVQLEHTLIDSERRRQFDEFRVAWASFREAAPLLEAMKAESEPMSAESMSTLLDVVRSRHREHPQSQAVALSLGLRALLGRKIALAAVAVLLGLAAYLLFVASPASSSGVPAGYLVATQGQPTVLRRHRVIPTDSPQPLQPGDQIQCRAGDEAWWLNPAGLRHIRGPENIVINPAETTGNGSPPESLDPRPGHSSMLPLALFAPIPALVEAHLLATTRGADGIAIYSPRIMTARLTPTILWRAEPGATYDLTLRDELEPDAAPWRMVAARPPVRFETVDAWRDRPLTPDHVYRMTIQRSDQPLSATDITFSTAATPTPPVGIHPARRLAAAYDALNGDPAKVGDALVELLSLPAPYANSELALRLELLAYGRLGLAEDFEHTVNQLRRLP